MKSIYKTMFLQARIHMPQAVPVLKRIAGLRQVRVAHHHVHGPDTGRKSGRKRITKKRLMGLELGLFV